jgi:hypothetical protein
MTAINPQKFTTEEFQEQASWIGKLFSPLNQFIQDVVSASTNGLTIQDNFAQEMKDIKWVNSGTNFPLKFKTKFAKYPKGIFPIYLFNNSLGSYSTLPPWVVWGYSDSQVTISDISGLTSGSTYTIRLLVIYE